jgi:hypothetical protein
MSSLLDKAIAARLREEHEEADRLFHEFVLDRARTVNESITSGGDVDIDAIVEGKSYKKGRDEDDEEVNDKKKKDQERKDGSKQKRSDVSEDAVEEGKTYKRGKDDEDIGDKKRKDQDRKDGAKQKRQTDESLAEAANDHTIEAYGVKGAQSTKWRKTFKDADALASWIDANDAEVEGQKDLKVEEGQLTATQGDDGTLVIVHDPAGADMNAVAAPMPMVDELPDVGGDLDAGDEFDMDLGGDIMAPDMEVSDDPLPGVDDLTDEAFESLKESLAEELKAIVVNSKDGIYSDGSKVSQETHSPIPNVKAEDRAEGAEPVEIKGDEHNGFDKEAAPKVGDHGGKAINTKGKATDGQKTV